MEPAGGSSNPIEPNSQKIYMFSLVIGLLIPIGFIYLKDLFDDKIRSREHINAKTAMPIIAEIGHIANMSSNLVVADKSRNITAEQFRILRTNLHFLLQDDKTILVTSTVSGEGKSFVALNLAAVLAISNKKVALLEFDLRKPRIVKNVGFEKRILDCPTSWLNKPKHFRICIIHLIIILPCMCMVAAPFLPIRLS